MEISKLIIVFNYFVSQVSKYSYSAIISAMQSQVGVLLLEPGHPHLDLR